MAYDLQEQEQIDALRAFWQRWGRPLIAVLVVALCVALGVQGYERWQARQAQAALVVFEQLQQAVAQAKLDRVQASSQNLIKAFPRTVYASMGALLAARASLDAGDLQGAKEPLQWAAESAKDPEYQWLARLNLAGVLLDEGAHEAGLKWLSGAVPEAWAASFADRRGDLLLASGQRDAARQAYREALDKLAPGAPLRSLVQLKLDALGEA